MTEEAPSLTCSVKPHELDARLRRGLEDICRRVAAKSAVEGRGADLLLRIYMAGFYHGEIAAQERAKP